MVYRKRWDEEPSRVKRINMCLLLPRKKASVRRIGQEKLILQAHKNAKPSPYESCVPACMITYEEPPAYHSVVNIQGRPSLSWLAVL